MNLSKFENILNTYTIKKDILYKRKMDISNKLDKSTVLYSDIIKARDVMSLVGIASQKEIKILIQELVSQALQSIFSDEYESISFEMEDCVSRNKPETNFWVVIDGKRRSMYHDLGGGIVDIVSIALRIIMWAISSPRTDNTIILDEPVRALHSNDMLESCGKLFKKLSETLGIQFIIITDVHQLLGSADTIFEVKQVNGISHVTKLLEKS